MQINETYVFSLLARAAYKNIAKIANHNSVLFNANLVGQGRHIAFTFANQAQANEVTDKYDFIWQYNALLTDFSGSVFQGKSGSNPIALFRRAEFPGDVVVGAGVFVAATGFNGSIWGGQTVKTI